MIVHDTLLAFLMYFHFVLLDYTHFFDEMSYFFIFLFFLNLIKFLLLMNLHFYSSFSTWMIFHGILCLLCLWWISTLSQLDENSYILFSLFFSCWCLFYLDGLLFLLTAWCFLKALSLLDGFPFYLALMKWNIPFFYELSFLNLMNSSLVSLSSLKTLPSGVESIRSTLPHLEILSMHT